MLSIRFTDNKEWWVSDKIFDRLFQSALKSGMSSNLEHWQHVVNANGGVDFSEIKDPEVLVLISTLRSTAEHDVTTIGNVNSATEDGSYRDGLLRFLDITKIN